MLHWLSAAIILWASFSGFIIVWLPTANPLRLAVDALNPQLTTLFMPFFLWRAALYAQAAPWRGWPGAGTQARLAMLVHMALYASITLVLVTGFLMMPKPWQLLGVLPMPRPVRGEAALLAVHIWHRYACMGLSGLIGVHLLAVARHQLRGTPVLNRMKTI
jgi:cytochrome b561